MIQAGSHIIAVYANDSASLGEHWKIVGGLRWDCYQAEIANTVNPSTTSVSSF